MISTEIKVRQRSEMTPPGACHSLVVPTLTELAVKIKAFQLGKAANTLAGTAAPIDGCYKKIKLACHL
jgi:hypothetical protein